MTSETPHHALISRCPSSTAQIKMCGGDLANKLHLAVVRCCVVCMSGLSQSKIVYTNMLTSNA